MSTTSLFGLFLILVHIAGIIAALDAVRRARTTQGAIAWAVLLLSFPYFALLPYLVLGSARFERYVGARRQENRRMRERVPHLPWDLDAEHDAVDGLPASARLTRMPLLHGNQVRLLVDGEATFAAIFAAIERAERQVLVQFFTIADDALGRRLFDALLARAAKGVEVYLLCDEIGSHGLPSAHLERLRAGGVKAYKFVTQSGFGFNRFQINFRNHRKLVVVDGEQAFIGGHNVSLLYLGAKPPLAPWRDTHIALEGPVVGCLQYTFAEDWYWSAGELPTLCVPPRRDAGQMRCQALPFGPADIYETCMLSLVEAINRARRRLWLTTPYLVPDEAVSAALTLAVQRGVEVRILVPSRPDHLIVYLASQFCARQAVHDGIEIYRYLPGFIHQKVWLVDDDFAVIGSANLDNRSLRLNFEQMVAVFDQGFASEVAAMLERDFEQARRLDRAQLDAVPRWRQAVERVAHLFSPVL
ncbi:cardiolipin synthase [Halotalea alkalilenta]|uniref:Cardiolipin synthase n=1 Tax=Halotalea alkalilenta TaxID=376489 RepID=A0A172YHV0_9GAMM|nr:cardiolipin synthase [Halotalea alkalilenta]ANF58829.1 cardiolipin synthase [Halotalea alkalilenta]